MGSYWDGVKQRWREMTGETQSGTGHGGTGHGGTGHGGTGHGGTGHGGTGSGGDAEWELIHDKFRQVVGREPYSFQELKDWWAGY